VAACVRTRTKTACKTSVTQVLAAGTARARLGTLAELGEHEIDVREQWRGVGCALDDTASIDSAKQAVSATG